MRDLFKFLVVDDDSVDRMALRRVLKHSDFQFELLEAKTASVATQLIAVNLFDCVFLDYGLPDCDGLTLVKQWREAGVKVPVIALTGQGSEETAVELMKAGASDYLPKARLSSETLTRLTKSALRVYYAECEAERAQQSLEETNKLLKHRNQELEQQRRQIQQQNLQLSEVSRLKSEFLATMSHELRTPLNAVIGFSQILLRQIRQESDARQHDMVRRILENGQHLLEIINDILDLSKIEAGRLDLRPEPLNITDLVHTTVDSLQPLADDKNIDLAVSIKTSNAQIVNDLGRLRQILVNLLSNAIKFTEGEGEVDVIVQDLSPHQIEIAVKDTGIGIADEQLSQVFDAFHQTDQSLSRKHRGTGLGLAITNLLVEMMGGSISVESKLDEGSCFSVSFPRHVKVSTIPSSFTFQQDSDARR